MADAKKVTDALYAQPIIDAAMIAQITKKSKVTAGKLIGDLTKLGILKAFVPQRTRKQRYYFSEYVELLRS
jgi:Fic family protein